MNVSNENLDDGLTEEQRKELQLYVATRNLIQRGLLMLAADVAAQKDLVIGELTVELANTRDQTSAIRLVSGERHHIKRSVYISQVTGNRPAREPKRIAIVLVRHLTEMPSPNFEKTETIRQRYEVEMGAGETFQDAQFLRLQLLSFLNGAFDEKLPVTLD